MSGYDRAYALIALLALLGVGFVAVAFTLNRLVRPARPARAKEIPYESGVDPVGSGWAQLHLRYYLYAYLYVIFAVESVFLFPWAAVVHVPGFGVPTLVEMAVFVAILALGLLYAWRKGVLRWS